MFVPQRFADISARDIALPIGCGQTSPPPSVLAAMIAALGLRRSDRVCEIGTGTGYCTALLAQLANEVVSLERFQTLAVEASARIKAFGLANVSVLWRDGFEFHLDGRTFRPRRRPWSHRAAGPGVPRAPRAGRGAGFGFRGTRPERAADRAPRQRRRRLGGCRRPWSGARIAAARARPLPRALKRRSREFDKRPHYRFILNLPLTRSVQSGHVFSRVVVG